MGQYDALFEAEPQVQSKYDALFEGEPTPAPEPQGDFLARMQEKMLKPPGEEAIPPMLARPPAIEDQPFGGMMVANQYVPPEDVPATKAILQSRENLDFLNRNLLFPASPEFARMAQEARQPQQADNEYDQLFYKTGKTKSEREELNRPLREAMQVPLISPETIATGLRGISSIGAMRPEDLEQGPIEKGTTGEVAKMVSGLTTGEGATALPLYMFPPTAVGLTAGDVETLPADVGEAAQKYQQGDKEGAAAAATRAAMKTLMSTAVIKGAGHVSGPRELPAKIDALREAQLKAAVKGPEPPPEAAPVVEPVQELPATEEKFNPETLQREPKTDRDFWFDGLDFRQDVVNGLARLGVDVTKTDLPSPEHFTNGKDFFYAMREADAKMRRSGAKAAGFVFQDRGFVPKQEPTTAGGEPSHATEIEGTRPLLEHEIRPRVGETTPLRGEPERIAREEAVAGGGVTPEAEAAVAPLEAAQDAYLRSKGFDPSEAPVERLPDAEMRKYPITRAILEFEKQAPKPATPTAEVPPEAPLVKVEHGEYAKPGYTAVPTEELPVTPKEEVVIPEGERGYAGLEPPTTPPVSEPVPGVPQKPSKIGQSIEAKAVEAKLTQGFAETAGYDPITIAHQSQLASDVIRASPVQARAMIRGEAPLPEGLRGTSLITAMEEHLLDHPNAQVAYEMANSPLTSATSAAAQEMRLMSERVPDSLTAKFAEIKAARAEGAKLRGETSAKVAKEITKEVVRTASKRPTWEAFVREIVC